MSSPGPHRSSFRKRLKDGLVKIFPSYSSSRPSSPRPGLSTSLGELDPQLKQATGSESTPHIVQSPSARVPLARTQTFPPGLHASTEGSTVVHKLALASLTLLAFPFTQEPEAPAVSLHPSSLPQPQTSAVIESAQVNPTIALGPENTTLPADAPSSLTLGVPTGDSQSHGHLEFSDFKATEVYTGAGASSTLEVQAAVLAPLTPLEDTTSAIPVPPTHLVQPPAGDDSRQDATAESSREGDRSTCSEIGSEDNAIGEVTQEESEAVRLGDLAYSCCDAFKLSGDLADITNAISALERALELTAEDDPSLPYWHDDLGFMYRLRFKGTGDLADVTAAVAANERAVLLAPEGHEDLPTWLNNLGVSYQYRFDLTGSLADITEAILAEEKAVLLIQEDDADLPAQLNNLGSSYRSRFDCTGNLADIAEAIAATQRAILLTPEDHACLPDRLNNLGCSYRSRFHRTGNLADIAEAISAVQRAVELTPDGHAGLPKSLNNLGDSYQSRFDRTGDVADITKAISAQQMVVHLTAEDNPSLPDRLDDLGAMYRLRFQGTADPADITAAVAAHERAVLLTPKTHAGLPMWLNNLAHSYCDTFEFSKDLADIMKAISALERSIQLTAEDDPSLSDWIDDLGVMFMLRFQDTGDLADVTAAVAAHERAVLLTSEDHADLPARLGRLGVSYKSRFDRTGNLADITEAISAMQRVVLLTPDDHASLPGRLSNLGNSYQSRFGRTSNLADITEAISATQRAVKLTPEDHANFPLWLNNLGCSYQSRFDHTGNLADITEAIAAMQKAVRLTPEGHADLPTRLNNLGTSYQSHFDYTGNLADIAEAISSMQRAVLLTPEGHTDLPKLLNGLGVSYHYRFNRTDNLADIMEAISAIQKAVLLTPEDHADLPAWLNDLGCSHRSRFGRTRNLADIMEAISAMQRAVLLTPEDHAGLPGRLNNLGSSLRSRFDRTGNLADITEAISAEQRATLLTPEDHADLPGRLNNLGCSYQSRFGRTGDLVDITEAISVGQRAVLLTPEGHADLPKLLGNLGSSCRFRFDCTGDAEDLNASLSYMKSAATSSFGIPQVRLIASTHWAGMLNQHTPLSPDVLSAFETAIDLLALVAGLEQTVEARYDQLQDAAGIAVDGAAAACRLQRFDKAVEWLEQGRCLVWNQLNDLRTPLDNLQVHDSQLAMRLADVSKQLQSAASTRNTLHSSLDMATKISLADEARSHLALSREWDNLLITARNIPGFESFLRPSPCSTLLQHLPESGSIVIVTVNQDQCDALALSLKLDEPLHIPLPDFSLEKANKYRHSLSTQLESRGVRVREADVGSEEELSGKAFGQRPMGKYRRGASGVLVHSVLKYLWLEVVKPIFEMLGYSKYDHSSDARPPRIWWCPTGAMSFLPIHAAGIYNDTENSESVLDYAVSSYTPTIGALNDRVNNHRRIDETVSGLFMTSQPKVKGGCFIPGTTKEVESIYSKATANGVRVSRSTGSELNVPDLLERLKNFSSVHLACHASQNAADPLQSRFILHEGKLNLGTIIQMNLEHADLAFLSACQTSTGVEKLSDEAVHLAAGMLAAGYRRVVATMWSIKDKHAPDVANDFYDYLWDHREEGSGGGFDGTLSAYALHHAIQRLRQRLDNSEDSLLTWVPYVHFGY